MFIYLPAFLVAFVCNDRKTCMDLLNKNLWMNLLNHTPFLRITLLVSFLVSFEAVAQTPAQIEQFRSLPPDQQRALAQQMGIDLEALGGQSASAQPVLDSQQEPLQIPESNDDLALQAEVPPEADGDVEPQLEPFGYDLFRQPGDSFTPALDVPIPTDYVMGPGDTLVVQLYGKENASYSLVINREGQVQFPEIGPLSLAGLKFSQAQNLINETVAEQMIGVKSSVTMGALRSIRIFVLGEVLNPGSYTVSSLSTMTNALFASGGVDGIGSLRNIQLKRSGELIGTLDLYDLLLRGDTSKDQRLLPGDVIFIAPVGPLVAAQGEVKRPAIYELKQERSLADLVALAGGYTPEAFPKISRVETIDDQGNRTVLNLDLTSTDGKQAEVKNGDTLTVAAVLDTVENTVTLSGHLKRPGVFSWNKGLRVSDLIPNAEALKPNPDLNTGLIVREARPNRTLEIIYFNLAEAMASVSPEQNPFLAARDQVWVFGHTEERASQLGYLIEKLQQQASKVAPTQTVTLNGLVNNPGIYPLQTDATLSELVNLAGGLAELAYGLEAEITRYSYDDSPEQNIEHISVPLDSEVMSQIIVQPRDSIRFRRVPNFYASSVVELEGEVMFPGTYSIRPGETLSEVLVRAGGLTELAFARAAIFSREGLRALEAKRIRDLNVRLQADIAASQLEVSNAKIGTSSVTSELLDELLSVKARGRMVIDLPSLLAGDMSADVTLVAGDRLVVPRNSQSITVVGEVQYPTSHLFDSALDVKDYIERSGDLNERADSKRIYVVKANGRVFLPERKGWFKNGGAVLEAGDTVVVPLDVERIDSLTLWSSVSQIVYQVALGAAAVNSF